MEIYRKNRVYRSGVTPPLEFEGTTEIQRKHKYLGFCSVVDGKAYVKTGEYIVSISLESKKVLWKKKEKNTVIVREGDGGRIYLTFDNKPSCLDSETGEIIWQYSEDGGFAFKAEDKVYSRLKKEATYYIGCHSEEDGSLIWEASDPLSSASFMVENDIVVGSSESGYCAKNASTGETLWVIEENEWLYTYFPDDSDKFRIHTATGCSIYKNAGPLVDDVVYAGYGTSRNHGILTAVNALNGELIWSTEVKEYPRNRLFHDGKIYFLYEDYLGCADAATGELLYEVEEKITPIGCHNPIIAGNYFIGGSGPYLSFFDLGKKEFAWKYKLKNKKDIFTTGVYIHKDLLIAYMPEDNEIYWFRSKK